MDVSGLLDVGGGTTVRVAPVELTESIGKVCRRLQAGPGRSGCPRLNSTALFPEVPAWFRKPGFGIAISHQKVGCSSDQVAVERLDNLDLVELLEVAPENPEDQSGFVLLYRQFRLIVRVPR